MKKNQVDLQSNFDGLMRLTRGELNSMFPGHYRLNEDLSITTKRVASGGGDFLVDVMLFDRDVLLFNVTVKVMSNFKIAIAMKLKRQGKGVVDSLKSNGSFDWPNYGANNNFLRVFLLAGVQDEGTCEVAA